MKLIIEIDVESSDFDETDLEVFQREAAEATSINFEVGRPVEGEDGDNGVFRMASLNSEYFKIRTEEK